MMNTRRSKRIGTKSKAPQPPVLSETESEDEEDSDFEGGLLNNILGLFMAMERPKRRRLSSNRATKRKPRPALREHASSSGAATVSSNSTPTLSRSRCKKPEKKQNSTAKAFSLDSDEEQPAKVSDVQVSNIKNRLDSFFKDVESSEDEFEKILTLTQKPADKKDNDFYTIISDGEDAPGPSVQCSTTGSSGSSQTTIKQANVPSPKANEKISDLFTLVDDILKDWDSSDENKSKPRSSTTKLAPKSLEELKKETEQILGNVSSLINDFSAQKKVEEVKKKSPEGPSCPICLDHLEGNVQVMATICGHLFCKPCITEVARTLKKCPTCRNSISMKKIHPIYMNI